jgi:hypothetical protein
MLYHKLIPELYSEINYIVRAEISFSTVMIWESLMNVTHIFVSVCVPIQVKNNSL